MKEKVSLNTFTPDDGVYFKATIAPRPRLHDGCVIEYRPPDYISRRTTQLATSQLAANEKYEDLAKAELKSTLERVTKWDQKDSVASVIDGSIRINCVLMRDIYDVVWGFEAAAELEAILKNS